MLIPTQKIPTQFFFLKKASTNFNFIISFIKLIFSIPLCNAMLTLTQKFKSEHSVNIQLPLDTQICKH